MKGIA